jgi:hypothetical protein
MAEPKALTYDEQKAAEAAFAGAPSNPKWTESARLLHARLSAAMQNRGKEAGSAEHPLAEKNLNALRR